MVFNANEQWIGGENTPPSHLPLILKEKKRQVNQGTPAPTEKPSGSVNLTHDRIH